MKRADSVYVRTFRHAETGEIHTVIDSFSAHPDEACDAARRVLARDKGYDLTSVEGDIDRCFADWKFLRTSERDGSRDHVVMIGAAGIVRKEANCG